MSSHVQRWVEGLLVISALATPCVAHGDDAPASTPPEASGSDRSVIVEVVGDVRSDELTSPDVDGYRVHLHTPTNQAGRGARIVRAFHYARVRPPTRFPEGPDVAEVLNASTVPTRTWGFAGWELPG